MDTFIKQILNISAADEWLHNNGLGWLISDRMLETASIIIGSFIIYFIGKHLIKWFIHYTIRSTAKHRSWHRKDIENEKNAHPIKPRVLADFNDLLRCRYYR